MKKLSLFFISLFLSTVTLADEACILDNGINVQTSKRRLYICENNTVIKEFTVSLGRKGIGKKYEGDSKTPLGLYELAAPRPSQNFGIFIPIQYPTKEQLSAGYSGSHVGIHGPIQPYRWLGPLNTLFNWTLGCIAVGWNDQISTLAQWIVDHPEAKILIRN